MTTLTNANLKLAHVWGDNFNDPSLAKWYQDTFEYDDLHRTKTRFLTLEGHIDKKQEGLRVPQRHAARMNRNKNKVQFIASNNETENGYALVLKPHITKERNLYRENFIGRDGKIKPMGDYVVDGAWLSTWTRKWSNKYNRQITDWGKSEPMTFTRGSVVKMRCNVSSMVMGGVRLSLWGMGATEAGVIDMPDKPAIVVAGQEYNTDGSIVEIDIPELENFGTTNFGNLAFAKCIGGKSGDTKPPITESIDINPYDLLKRFGIDLRVGWHEFVLRWDYDGKLYFYCDNVLINTDFRGVNMYAYLILSSEVCSGLKHRSSTTLQPHENVEQGFKNPRDDGLSGRNWIDYMHLVDKHRALVDYVHVYKILANNPNKVYSGSNLTINREPKVDIEKLGFKVPPASKINTDALVSAKNKLSELEKNEQTKTVKDLKNEDDRFIESLSTDEKVITLIGLYDKEKQKNVNAKHEIKNLRAKLKLNKNDSVPLISANPKNTIAPKTNDRLTTVIKNRNK